VKFGIDKRKAHLSDLIFSGQIKHQKALLELQKTNLSERTFVQKQRIRREKPRDIYR